MGKWIGSATGGVKAPEPVLLPDPRTRFVVTASRLDGLAQNHPMAEWLRFMAALSRAQHAAATTLVCPAPPDEDSIEQAVAHRMPPVAADGHRRQPVWREGLALVLDGLNSSNLSKAATTVIDELKDSDEDALESLASAFLQSGISPRDIGKVLYVAAALQVYFTLLASRLPIRYVRLLLQRGLCPCCGSTPVSGVITAKGDTPGTRYLYCSLCSTAWNHVRAVCVTCGGSGKVELKGIEGSEDAVKAETCGDCQSYAKMFYQAKDMQVDAFADDLATLALDLLVAEAGWARHAPNPLLLVR
jgi:FdhE protein